MRKMVTINWASINQESLYVVKSWRKPSTYRHSSDGKVDWDLFIISEIVGTLIKCGLVIINIDQFNCDIGNTPQHLGGFCLVRKYLKRIIESRGS